MAGEGTHPARDFKDAPDNFFPYGPALNRVERGWLLADDQELV